MAADQEETPLTMGKYWLCLKYTIKTLNPSCFIWTLPPIERLKNMPIFTNKPATVVDQQTNELVQWHILKSWPCT